jgi:hypothetical protein
MMMVLPVVVLVTAVVASLPQQPITPTTNPVLAVATGPSDWNMGYTHTESEAGMSWYTHIWQIFPGGFPPQSWGIGMPGTWLHGSGIPFKDACACNPNGWPNNPAVRKDGGNGCCKPDGTGNPKIRDSCSFLYETIEGGPQDDERFRVMANVGCFSFTSGTGLFLSGGNGHAATSPANQHPCAEIAFVSLSNGFVMQPNGASFARDGLLGVGYVHTPLGKVSAADKRKFWTLVFDTENFAGPLGYFLPEWWQGRDRSAAPNGSHPDPSWYQRSKLLLDMGSPGITGMHNDQVAMEWNHGYTYQQNSSDGKLFIKLPDISFPFKDGELILAMGNQVHTDAQLSVPLEAALAAGRLDTSTIMANARPANCRPTVPRVRNATFHLSTKLNVTKPQRSDERTVTIGHYETIVENGTCLWKLTGKGDFLHFPKFFDENLNPVDISAVPPELAQQEFAKDETVRNRHFSGLGNLSRDCYSSPGPSDPRLFCAQSASTKYWLGWRWYRFIDQPALQQVRLSAVEKKFLQRRVETLHGMVSRLSRWLKPGQVPGAELAHVDPVALVTPPRGLEKGFVPIALYEGPARPEECVVSWAQA